MHGLKKSLYFLVLMICSGIHNSFAAHIELSDIRHSGNIGDQRANHHHEVAPSNNYEALMHSASQFRVYDDGDESCCTPKCAGISVVGTCVVAGVIYGILAGVGVVDYQNYKIDNQAGKPINLHFRGNSFNCYKTVSNTDKDGKTTTKRVQVDCTKVLYPGDRTTLRNYGHLTELGAYLYDANWGSEYGWYGQVTNKGLKDLDWYVTKDGNSVAFNRHFEPVINETAQVGNDFRSYHNDTFLDEHTFASAPQYYNLRGSVDLEQK